MKIMQFIDKVRFKYFMRNPTQLNYLRGKKMEIGKGCDIQNPFIFYGTEYSLIATGNNVTITSSSRFNNSLPSSLPV